MLALTTPRWSFSPATARLSADGNTWQYLLPYDCDLRDLPSTAIAGDDMTALLRSIRAGRLLVLLEVATAAELATPRGCC